MIITITNDINKTDFDLYERVTEGFQRQLIGPKDPIPENAKIVYCHGENLFESMTSGLPTVSLGRKWIACNIDEYIINGVTGYISDSIDELRYIITKLLAQDVDKLAPLAYNARIRLGVSDGN